MYLHTILITFDLFISQQSPINDVQYNEIKYGFKYENMYLWIRNI